MKNFLFRQQGYLTTNSDTIATNNLTLADFLKPCGLSPKNNRLLLADLGGMLFTQSEKEIAERGNSIYLLVANSSTPFKRAFFVRSLRTPKENNQLKIQQVAFLQNELGMPKTGHTQFLSMVGRNGQRLTVGCLPLVAVFHPVTFYRQAWKLAVDIQKLLVEFSTMIYKFLSIQGNKRLKITVYANSKAEALSRIQWLNKPLCIVSNLKAQGGVYA